MRKYYRDGFVTMTKTLNAVADADDANDRTSPGMGRAILGAIRSTSQASVSAHLVMQAQERALLASEKRHDQGVDFLFSHLVNPVIEKVGTILIRIMSDDQAAAAPAQENPFVMVVTPGGKVGYIAAEALSPLDFEQICYTKDGAAWKITGYFGGAPQ